MILFINMWSRFNVRLFSAFSSKVETKLQKVFVPLFMQVKTADHVGDEQLQSEEYLDIRLVSHKFAGTTLLERHQMVHEVIADEIAKVHALNLNLLTPDQWKEAEKKQENK